jgi:hypothetical protein
MKYQHWALGKIVPMSEQLNEEYDSFNEVLSLASVL